jgi:HK97 family phage prohead protease
MPITDFPQAGGDKPVSLRNSQWDVFDLDFAEALKRDHPAIWEAGGNIRGDEQFAALAPIAERQSMAPQTDAEEAAIRLREAWGARHYEDFRLPGVVAQIKWLVVGSRGEGHMKQVVNDAIERAEAKTYTRALLTEAKAAEDGQRVYTFRATSEAVDRQGEVVSADGWDFSAFEANPVILDSHDYSGIDAIVGKALPPLRRMADTWEVDVVFSGTPKGQLAQQLVDEGSLRAVSVGFRSMQRAGGARDGAPLTHVKQELLEISVVPIPANPEAVRLRSIGADDIEIDDDLSPTVAAKAGRTLSAKNEQALRQAVQLLADVLAGLGPAEKAADDDAAAAVTEADQVAVVETVAEIQEATDTAEETSADEELIIPDAVVEALRAVLAGKPKEV